MKAILGLILSAMSAITFSATIDCYNGGKNIYHGTTSDILYDENYLYFIENNTKNNIIIFGDCVARFSGEEVKRNLRKNH